MTTPQPAQPLMQLLTRSFESIRSISDTEIQHSPLMQLRHSALQYLAQNGLPTPRDEEWKYLNLAPYLRYHYQIPDRQTEVDTNAVSENFPLDAHRIILINGYLHDQLLSLPSAIRPVILRKAIAQIANNGKADQSVWNIVGSVLHPAADPFVAINTALFEDGIVLKVADSPTKPLHFLLIGDSNMQHPVLTNPRIAIVLDPKVRATVIISSLTIGSEPVFTNGVIEIIQKEHSALNLVFLQTDASNNYGISTTRILQKRYSRSEIYTVTAGNGMIRNTLGVCLDEPESQTALYGLSLLRNTETVDNHTLVEHNAPNCRSDEQYRSIVSDRSLSIFNGKIFVKSQAQQTNAYQSNRNVLLSDDARVYTKPQLEIFADDVRCTHGATVGQLDHNAIFYLRSRGLSQATAMLLMLHAFAAATYQTLEPDSLREWIDTLVSQRLAQMVGSPESEKIVVL